MLVQVVTESVTTKEQAHQIFTKNLLVATGTANSSINSNALPPVLAPPQPPVSSATRSSERRKSGSEPNTASQDRRGSSTRRNSNSNSTCSGSDSTTSEDQQNHSSSNDTQVGGEPAHQEQHIPHIQEGIKPDAPSNAQVPNEAAGKMNSGAVNSDGSDEFSLGAVSFTNKRNAQTNEIKPYSAHCAHSAHIL